MLIRCLIAAALALAGCATGGSEQRFADAGQRDGTFRPNDSALADGGTTTRDSQLPMRKIEDHSKPLAGSTSTTCVVENTGTVLCWGSNSRGQLGRGSLEPQQDHNPAPVLDLSEVLIVEGSSTRFCALTARDQVFCWGHATRYASGVTSEEGVLTKPTQLVDLPAISEVRVGQVHSCALEKDGGVWCWGGNYAGQVGNGGTSVEEPPARVKGLEKIKGIAVGSAVTCSLSNDGTVRCWGAAASGIVPTPEDSITPVVIDGLGPVAAIRVGANNACAIEDSGALKCWGRNRDLQLGPDIDVEEVVTTPIAMELPEVPVDVQVGRATICALGESGTLYCWGDGGNGEIGDGETMDRGAPTAVPDLADVLHFGSFYNHTCAMAAEGLYCWGSNARGQLGATEGDDVLSPMKVSL